MATLPKYDGMDDMDSLWVVFWHRRLAEIAGGGQGAWAGRGSSEAAIANLRDLIRVNSPRAYAEITNGERIAPHRR